MGGVLQRLGVDFGDKLMPAQDGVNEKGFYEHAGIVELHEKLLEALGYHWSDVRPMPESWWRLPDVAPVKSELETLVKNDFGTAKLWGVKDPRMCRLMPVWNEILANVGSECRFVLVVRDPVEVAKSLSSRDGMVANGAHIAWLWHVLEAERASRGYPRVFVSYKALLENWKQVASTISEELHIDWPIPVPDAEQEIDDFLEAGLRHHDANGKRAEDSVASLACELYSRIIQGDLTYFDTAHETFMREMEKLGPYLDTINQMQSLQESESHCRRALEAEKANAVAQIEYRDALVKDLEEQIDHQRILMSSKKSLLKLLIKAFVGK